MKDIKILNLFPEVTNILITEPMYKRIENFFCEMDEVGGFIRISGYEDSVFATSDGLSLQSDDSSEELYQIDVNCVSLSSYIKSFLLEDGNSPCAFSDLLEDVHKIGEYAYIFTIGNIECNYTKDLAEIKEIMNGLLKVSEGNEVYNDFKNIFDVMCKEINSPISFVKTHEYLEFKLTRVQYEAIRFRLNTLDMDAFDDFWISEDATTVILNHYPDSGTIITLYREDGCYNLRFNEWLGKYTRENKPTPSSTIRRFLSIISEEEDFYISKINQSLTEYIESNKNTISSESLKNNLDISLDNGYGIINFIIESNGVPLGNCRVYLIHERDEDCPLGWYFDGIEEVAYIHYNEYLKNNKKFNKIISTSRCAYLTGMYVNKEFRSLGIGKELMDAVELKLASLDIEHLLLVSAIYRDNEDVNKVDNFYLKNNFKLLYDSKSSDGKLFYKKVNLDLY